MSNRLFVGNLPYEATEEELRAHFSRAGSVRSIFIPLDRETSRPRGFAFIEFETSQEAAAAIGQLHQKPFMDRPLVVNEARPNEARPSGGFRAPGRPSGGGPRPGPPPPSGGFGDEGGRDRTVSRRAAGPRSRRRSGKKGGWDEGPRKEPIPEKRRSQIFSGYDDAEDDVEQEAEDIEFDDIATRESDSGDDEK
jgi:RNA recognition motif-containing protein